MALRPRHSQVKQKEVSLDVIKTKTAAIKTKRSAEEMPIKEKQEQLSSQLAQNDKKSSTSSASTSHSHTTESALTRERFLGDPSCIDFLCQKKLPRSAMKLIMNSPKHNEVFIVHTEDLRLELEKSASHISNIIGRLESQGYINVISYNTNGTRQIEVNPSIKP
jgi:hypothetical protein